MTSAQDLERWARRALASVGHVSCCAGLALSAACSTVQLVPLQPTRGSEALVVGSGVEVRADTDAPVPFVPPMFTPVRLVVVNTGDTPVYVHLDDIQLLGKQQSLDAVPPAQIPARQRVASLGTDPSSPFVSQQTTGGGGPRVGRTEVVLVEPQLGAAPVGPSGRSAARLEVLRGAFSGGPIASGEARAGYVYFRSVPKDAGRLTLRVGVRPSPEGSPRSVEIEYAVRSG